MTTIRSLFAGHLIALAFGLGGLLIALPHPELWAGSRFAGTVFNFGMTYAGPLHISLAAATMLAFGLVFLGLRRTLIFFITTVSLSLTAELIGTGTGWPFGNYAYNEGLGFKILGRVPFTIPLSWFSIGFSAFLLGSVLAATRVKRHQTFWSIALGAYLLTVWDLVLDPAMASAKMPIRFWTWFERGPYFDMPVQNFVGWTLTGILFMTVSRLLWRRNVRMDEFPAWIPLGIYLANMGFAMALSMSVGLWEPTLAAIVFGCVPAVVAWWSQRTRRPVAEASSTVSHRVIRAGARLITARGLDVDIVGATNLPSSGPAMIVSRHYHHLYDGAALLSGSPRYLHMLVGLDWIEHRPLRWLMELLCKLAGWPVVLRSEFVHERADRSAYAPAERLRYLRRAVDESVALLRAGGALVVFPEGYPVVDPSSTPNREADELLPFQPGFVRLVDLAQRRGCLVPIIPVGLSYSAGAKTRLTMRFGSPIYLRQPFERNQVLDEIERSVRALSQPSIALEPSIIQEAVQP
jgi:uncharacterized membrane protein